MFVPIVLNGVVFGAMIALMAVGLSLVYGILRVVNFAHGEFYMFGAVMLFFGMTRGGIDYVWASLISVMAVGLLGWVVERLVFRRFHGDIIGGAIAAIALSMGFLAIAWLIFGPEPKGLAPVIAGTVKVLGTSIAAQRLLMGGVSLIVLSFLAWLIKYTKLGKAMRAVQQDSEAALAQGISVNAVCGVTFAIAAALAALAGVLMAPIFTIEPAMGIMPLMFALIVVILGGMGSVTGVFLASFIIGFQQSLTATLLTPELVTGVGFGLVILILVLRPRGLMGHD